ncbi:hypothetical protein HND97_10405 [Vibrio cholerae]|nr:hypothetical protein HND97_10405 [Vibrio cholerae]
MVRVHLDAPEFVQDEHAQSPLNAGFVPTLQLFSAAVLLATLIVGLSMLMGMSSHTTYKIFQVYRYCFSSSLRLNEVMIKHA